MSWTPWGPVPYVPPLTCDAIGQGERPEWQLRRGTPAMAALVCQCWAQEPSARPSFQRICSDLEAMAGTEDSRRPPAIAGGAGHDGDGAAAPLGGLAPVTDTSGGAE
jgi:hypothetical protein